MGEAVAPRGLLTKREKRVVKIKKSLGLWLMFAPVIIFLGLFNYAPLYGILIAFKDYAPFKGVMGSPWVGFSYFGKFLTDHKFWVVMKNTVVLNFFDIIFGFTAPILFALLANEIMNTKFKRVTQTISYLPHFLSYVVVAGLFYKILSPSSGLINIIIMKLGGEPINFMTSSAFFRPLVVFVEIWKSVGWGAILYFATISGIDSQLYDAAYVDGAGRLRQVFVVTIPSMLSIIVLLLIFRISTMFTIGFARIYNFSNPLVMDVADVISVYVFRVGLVQGQYSYTAAIGLVQSVIAFTMLFVANKVSAKVTGLGLW